MFSQIQSTSSHTFTAAWCIAEQIQGGNGRDTHLLALLSNSYFYSKLP